VRITATRLLAAGALTTLALAGCSSGGTESSQGATSSASARASASPSPSPAPRSLLKVRLAPVDLTTKQQKVADVVGDYWRRYGTAVSTRDLAGSGLASVVTSTTGVRSTKQVVASLKSKNERYRGTLVVTVVNVSFGSITATVDACLNQTKSRLVNKSGQTVGEPNKQNVLPVIHTLVKQGNVWLVDKVEQGAFTCSG
jgi:hypothetical protein